MSHGCDAPENYEEHEEISDQTTAHLHQAGDKYAALGVLPHLSRHTLIFTHPIFGFLYLMLHIVIKTIVPLLNGRVINENKTKTNK